MLPAQAIRAGLFGLAACVLAGSAGCSTAMAPDSLRVASSRYGAAFDAVVAVARDAGMPAMIRDRRSGVIETGPKIAPSMFEPWSPDGASLGDRLGHTVALNRRRARFVFSRPESDWTYEDAADTLAGPDVLGLDRADADRTRQDGELELRVWVFVEQSHRPGIRRDTWTRSATSQYKVIQPEGAPLPHIFWTPVRRDPAFERRLLDHVRDVLGETPTLADAPANHPGQSAHP